MVARNLILELLLAPRSLASLSAMDWDLLVRQGQRANLLSRLAHVLADMSLLDTVPDAPRQHLCSAMRVTDRQTIAVRWEVHCLLEAFSRAGIPLILLKGAAYLMAGLPASKGRMFSDVDIIVAKPLIAGAESALMQHGWRSAEMSDYDQRYYRQWMHELPPMTHVRRGTTVDVHHTILPETARLKVNTAALLADIGELPGTQGIHVLPPIDMLLHSATHLFHEGEFDNALRDLFDLDAMLRHFPQVAGGETFWIDLVPRASVLGLTRPLYYALRYTTLLLGTPVPETVMSLARKGRPARAVVSLMDACYTRALLPLHASLGGAGAKAARAALYLRSHWVRMPMHLLTLHLGRKALTRLFEKKPEAPTAPAIDR